MQQFYFENEYIDCQDMTSNWKVAKVESFQNNDMVVVTFEGWEKKFNEVLKHN